MSELRKDPIVNRWVIISEERGKRPSDFAETPSQLTTSCPFCAGNEHLTPSEIMAFRHEGTMKDQPGWSLRVVPNKFPALMVEGQESHRHNGFYEFMDGLGAHEVIIESPQHQCTLEEMNAPDFTNVIRAYRDRIRDLRNDTRLKYALIFKNQGAPAGATVEHTHSQLIATPVVPKTVEEELRGSQDFHQTHNQCVFCGILNDDRKDNRRIVLDRDGFITLEPFAARFPFETWILPATHEVRFEDMNDEKINALASVFQETLMRLRKALNHPPYNFVLHTAPLNTYVPDHAYHWHIEIIPKLTRVAGFEWGSGFFINPTAPENAATYLRQVRL